ncbi:MAG: ABC transporter substrate-binding protein [Acidimicrobiaceae bacterium]|nr:ABC transporter substrate-binding protein [Acidimicrobiaceae bacterium]
MRINTRGGRSVVRHGDQRLRFVVAASVVALVAAACGSSGSASSASSTTTAASATASSSASPITLPVIGDFTGSDAFFGTGQVQGMGPAIAALNKSGGIGGHPLKLEQCDTQSTVSGAQQCATKFASQPVVLTVSVIANLKAAIPTLSNSVVLAGTNLLNPPYSSNAFQIAPSGATVDDVVDQVAKASHFSTIGIIATDDAVGESQLGFIKAAAGSLKLDTQFISATATDDTVAMQKLISANVPMIYVAALGAERAAVIKAYNELKPKMPLVVTGADASYGFLKGISSYEPTSFYTIPGTPLVPGDVPSSDAAKMSAYISAEKAAIGHAPDTINVSGAYAIDVAIALLKGAGVTSSLSAKEAWLHSHTISALTDVSYSNPKLNVLSNYPPGFDKISGTSFTSASMNLSS